MAHATDLISHAFLVAIATRSDMDECKHVKQVKLAVDKSFLNPRNWSCCECGTTESVWVRQLALHLHSHTSVYEPAAGVSTVQSCGVWTSL